MEKINSYVIVGNGIAGLSAAETIRKKDKKGKITLISKESYLTYYRVKLSHYISKTFNDKELFVHNEEWYKEQDIDLILGTEVKKVNSDLNEVEMENGDTIKYNKLLLATGSTPFIPPIKGHEKEGVFALRTIEDLKEEQSYFKNCRSVTVIGGGLLGLEAAWAISKLGKNVNVIEQSPYILNRQLDEELSELLENLLNDKGINIYTGYSTDEILGKEKVEGIRLGSGREIKTDAVVISAGIRPALNIVKDSDIKCGKGVQVNSYMETCIDNIYAAGDVAEFNGRIIGLWGISAEQGKIVGENMTGGNAEYKLPELTTMLNLKEISVFSAGNVKDYDETIGEIDVNNKVQYKLFLCNGKVTGGVVINDMSKVPKVKKLISNNVDLTEMLENNMGFYEIIENI